MEQQSGQPALPPQAILYQLSVGYYVPRALYVATRLGVADLLRDGPRSAAELAAATGTNADALRRVLRLLASVGVFDEREDGTFGPTELSRCLRSDVPDSARNMVLLFTGPRTQEAWADLEYCVRTGEPAYRKRGIADPFADMAKDPETTAVFDAAMADGTRFAALAVGASYDFSKLGTLVDVGGGNGALLSGLLSIPCTRICAGSCSIRRTRSSGPARRSRPRASPSAAPPSRATSSPRCRAAATPTC